MPDKKPEGYKTEDDLKKEAMLRREQEKIAADAQPPESKLKKSFNNYWYHYKWHTVAGVALVFLACLFIGDTVLRAKPDATIVMISGEYYPQDRLDELRAGLEQIAWDRNGDGKVYILVDFNRITGEPAGEAVPAQDEVASQMKLVAVVAAGTDPLYLMDETAYDRLLEMGGADEAESGGADVFATQSVPADRFGFPGMKFYMRYAPSAKQDYYQYCAGLLQALNQ